MGMLDWFRRRRDRTDRQEARRTELDVRRDAAEVEILELRNAAVKRVVEEASDPIEGLGVVARRLPPYGSA
jgi:hypothetical protein